MDDSICRRALAFARGFRWVNARVSARGPAPPEIIARYGTSGSTNYGEVRIEMDWSEEDKSELVERGVGEDLLAFIDTPTELRVVCSATDVIYHDFPGIQLD